MAAMLDETRGETVPPRCGTIQPVKPIHLLLGLVLGLIATAVQGAEFLPVEDECNGRQALIRGPIEPGDYERFLDFMARHVAGDDQPAVQDPDVLWTVELDSPGGDLDEAMRIGRFLRDTLATTEVTYRYARRPDGVLDYARSGEVVCLDGDDRLSGCEPDLVEAECTGACLLVWLGGATRHANEGRLGRHGLGDGQSLGDYFAALEIPETQRARLLDPAAGDAWLDWSERHALGGRAPAHEALLAACPPPLTRDESFRSVASPDADLRNRLMDRAGAHRACRLAREAEVRAPWKAHLARRLDGATRGALAASRSPR